MTEFKKYMHLERFGNDEVQGIELGRCYIFPKIDGTNGSIWVNEGGQVRAGSRNREVSLESDNAGFCAHVKGDTRYKYFFDNHPSLRLYGEWLVRHSLKTYREDAWRKFYVFDVYSDQAKKYLPYDEYQEYLEEFDIDYIPSLSIVNSATYENLLKELENNTFLIEEGKGTGEGITIKNYEYENKYGRLCFAKVVTNAFKEKHFRAMGPTDKKFKAMIEETIANEYVEPHLVDKSYSKIVNEHGGWNSKYIPKLLGLVWHDLITEEIWNIVKKNKNPIINFKTLHTLTVMKIKRLKPELF